MRTPRGRLFVIGALALAALAALFCSRPRTAAARPAAIAEPGDPQLIDLTGYKELLAKNRGKAVMVTFWATWSEPSRTEYPMMVSFSKEYGPEGLAVIGVSLDEDSDMPLVRKFLTTFHPDFPNYRQRPGIDPDAFYQGVNPEWRGTMPQTDFYARDGHLARYFIGDKPKDAFVQAIRLILAVPLTENHSGGDAVSGH